MSEKISKEKLTELSDELREKVQKAYSDEVGKIAHGEHSFESFSKEILPQLIRETFLYATFHSEALVYKALKEVGLTTENNDHDEKA